MEEIPEVTRMAKKKRGRRRQGLVSKAANLGLILLGLSRPLKLILGIDAPSFGDPINSIIVEASAGLSTGALDVDAAMRFYGPVGAAVGLGFLKSYLMRKFPVRR